MEISCARCHQTVLADSCYCPACGLPQFVYSADAFAALGQPEHGPGAPRDASSVEWKTALRLAMMLAVPAGFLCSAVSPAGFLSLFWMGAAAAWAVALYMRSVKPAWITLGAGARIGLVTALLGGWLAFGVSGSALFVERYVLHQAGPIDAEWKGAVAAQQQMMDLVLAGMETSDASQLQEARAQSQGFYASMLTPEGHAGWQAVILARNSCFLLLFGIAGGALGARLAGRRRRPEV